MMENMELVDFKQPENGQIYVTKIKWSNTKIQLVHLLQERFSPFGLLHFVNVDQTDCGDWYAYVNFYSVLSAQKALQTLSCLVVNGSRCRLVLKKREMARNGQPLYLNQCIDLINFYLGFNAWSSQIVYHQKEEEKDDQVTYTTAVKLILDDGDGIKKVEGVGVANAEFSNVQEKTGKISMAQKCSKNAAMVNAFAKVILVLIADGDKFKVGVRIDTSRKDPFYFNSIWDEKPIIESVNEIEEDEIFE